jgi:putative hydrolase
MTQPFGDGSPFDGQSFDMNALGAMLQQLGQMMQSGSHSTGAVNWDMAESTAQSGLARTGDPTVSESDRAAVVAAIDLAETWLDSVTVFPRTTAAGHAWSRGDWLTQTLPAWQVIVAPIAEHVQSVMGPGADLGGMDLGALGSGSVDLPPALREALPDGIPPEAMAMLGPLMGMARQMGATMFGLQLGQGLAALAGEVFGSSDVGIPLTADYRPALIPANIARFTEGLGIDADEVRIYIALREVAHQRLFAHVPWLRARLEGALDAYARGIQVDTDRLQEALGTVDPSALSDPQRLTELLGEDAFAPVDTPEQKLALARLETLLALIEGWVDDVVISAAAERLPAADRLAETMRRRRAAGGPAEKTFASLVGLELRPRALREAGTLWTKLRTERDLAGRDALWEHPDLLPDHEDLTDPDAFLSRQSDFDGPPEA